MTSFPVSKVTSCTCSVSAPSMHCSSAGVSSVSVCFSLLILSHVALANSVYFCSKYFKYAFYQFSNEFINFLRDATYCPNFLTCENNIFKFVDFYYISHNIVIFWSKSWCYIRLQSHVLDLLTHNVCQTGHLTVCDWDAKPWSRVPAHTTICPITGSSAVKHHISSQLLNDQITE